MSFFQKVVHKKNNDKQKVSLRAYDDSNHKRYEKKALCNILHKGSMTVEAAIIMPIFIFAILNLLSIVDIIRVHSNIQAAMTETAKEMAVYGYAYDKFTDGEKNNLALSILGKELAKNKIKNLAGRDYLDHSMIKGGSNGLWFIKTDIMYQNDMIDLIVRYRVTPLFQIAPWRDIFMINRCRVHAWTGYDLSYKKTSEEEASETMVYVTEYGDVYHRTRTCTHLKLSISSIGKETVESKRNENGEKYHKCEKCGRKPSNDIVYITNMGNKYHTTLSCSGLKRTISEVPLSETGLPPCKKCG